MLEEEGLKPDCIAGSSMGAIVGALYAFTGSTSLLDELCDALRLSKIAKLSDNPLKDGLHGGLFRQQLEHHLAGHLGDATIGDCKIPFVCVAGKVAAPIDWLRIIKPGFTDYVTQCVTLHVFDANTRLIDAIMASSAIPVVFSPVEIDGNTYVDLVHFGSIPARTLKNIHHPDVIIATDTNPLHENLRKLLPASWKEFLDRGYEELEKSKQAADLIITPAMPAGVFRFDKAKDFMESGRKATEKMLPEIRELIGG